LQGSTISIAANRSFRQHGRLFFESRKIRIVKEDGARQGGFGFYQTREATLGPVQAGNETVILPEDR
jgi:hypothetical protein